MEIHIEINYVLKVLVEIQSLELESQRCPYNLFLVGATAPLIIAGASLAVSGGATGFGAGIADLKISNNKCKEAQVLIDRDVELTMDLLLLEKV